MKQLYFIFRNFQKAFHFVLQLIIIIINIFLQFLYSIIMRIRSIAGLWATRFTCMPIVKWTGKLGAGKAFCFCVGPGYLSSDAPRLTVSIKFGVSSRGGQTESESVLSRPDQNTLHIESRSFASILFLIIITQNRRRCVDIYAATTKTDGPVAGPYERDCWSRYDKAAPRLRSHLIVNPLYLSHTHVHTHKEWRV